MPARGATSPQQARALTHFWSAGRWQHSLGQAATSPPRVRFASSFTRLPLRGSWPFPRNFAREIRFPAPGPPGEERAGCPNGFWAQAAFVRCGARLLTAPSLGRQLVAGRMGIWRPSVDRVGGSETPPTTPERSVSRPGGRAGWPWGLTRPHSSVIDRREVAGFHGTETMRPRILTVFGTRQEAAIGQIVGQGADDR